MPDLALYVGRQGFRSVNPEIQITEDRIIEVLLYIIMLKITNQVIGFYWIQINVNKRVSKKNHIFYTKSIKYYTEMLNNVNSILILYFINIQ